MNDIPRQLELRNYRAVLATLSDVEAINHDPVKLNWRGTALAGLRMVDEARVCFERAIDLEPDEPRYRLSLAMLLSGAEPERAQTLFHEAISLNPNAASAHMGLAQLAARRGDLPHAESLFRTALRAQPDAPAIHFGLGHLLIQQGKLDDALRAIAQGLSIDAKNPDGLAAMGRAFIEKGSLDFARKALENALALSPRHSAALLFACQLALREGRLDHADHYIRLLREQHPNDRNAASIEAHLALRLGQAQRAAAALDHFLALRPGDLRATLQRAALCASYQDAINLMLGQLPHTADQRRLWTEIVQLAASRDTGLALSLARRWSQELSDDSWAWNHLCTMAEIERVLDEAHAAAVRTEALEPDLIQAQLVLARSELRAGQWQQAHTRLSKMLRPVDDEHPERLYPQQRYEGERLLARADFELGNGQAAVEGWAQAARRLDAIRLPALAPDIVRPELPEALTDPHSPVWFLVGGPGSGVELIALCVQSDPRFQLLADRWNGLEPRRDLFSEMAWAMQPSVQSDLLHIRKRYLDRRKRIERSASRMMIDWLPALDARSFDVVRAALPGARFLIVQRDPRDALLDVLSSAGRAPGASDAKAAADAIRAQKRHLGQIMMSKGDAVVPLLFEFWLADPLRELSKLAQLLGLAEPDGSQPLDIERLNQELGGLSRFWPSQSWRRLEAPLADAYARLMA